MTARARVMLTKRVPAGQGVSYGHTYITDRETTLALVPLGYADGVPRAASNAGPVRLGGAQPTDRRPGLHGPVRARLRRRPGGRRRRGDPVRRRATTANRPPTTGPRRSARSTTRSSPGSAAPGCPGSTTVSRASRMSREPGRRDGRRRQARLGIVGAVGRRRPRPGWPPAVAAERALVAPASQRRPATRTRDEPFGELPSTRRSRSTDGRTAPTSTSRSSSRRTPGGRTGPTVVFVHGFCLDMGTFHFQRKALAERGRAPDGLLRPARPRPVRPPGHRRVRPAPRSATTLRAVIDGDRPGRADGAGRPLDGRHDHHGVRRAAPGAVRRPGRRRGADRHLGRPARRRQASACPTCSPGSRGPCCRWSAAPPGHRRR